MFKTIILSLVIMFICIGCSTTRVLVKDCKDVGDGMEQCELIKKL